MTIIQKIEYFRNFYLVINWSFSISVVWLACKIIGIATWILEVFVIPVYLLSVCFSVFTSESTWIAITESSIAHNYTKFYSLVFLGITKIVIHTWILLAVRWHIDVEQWICRIAYPFVILLIVGKRFTLQSGDLNVNSTVVKLGVSTTLGSPGIMYSWCDMKWILLNYLNCLTWI